MFLTPRYDTFLLLEKLYIFDLNCVLISHVKDKIQNSAFTIS